VERSVVWGWSSAPLAWSFSTPTLVPSTGVNGNENSLHPVSSCMRAMGMSKRPVYRAAWSPRFLHLASGWQSVPQPERHSTCAGIHAAYGVVGEGMATGC
jgi:hypothetical protein